MESIEKYHYNEWKKIPNEKWPKMVRCTKWGSGFCNFCYKHDFNLYSFKCSICDDFFDRYHAKWFLKDHDSMYCLEFDAAL
jgi:hypothetical protein